MGFLQKIKADPYDIAKKRITDANNKKKEDLDLSNLGLKKFPSEVNLSEDIKTINLAGNNLEKLPKIFFKKSDLEKINLNANNIKEIPPGIKNLTRLQSLALSGNELEELPLEICELEDLKELLLNDNNLKGLPENIGNLKDLESLLVCYNEIKKVPHQISQLTNLKKFALSNNPLEPPYNMLIGKEVDRKRKLLTNDFKIKDMSASDVQNIRSPKNDIDEELENLEEDLSLLGFDEEEIMKEMGILIHDNKINNADDILLELHEMIDKLRSLKSEENMINIHPVEQALRQRDLDRAEELTSKLIDDYEEYMDIIKKLENLDEKISSLSKKLADDEIDMETFKDAKRGIEYEKHRLEEDLNKLRKEVIYEDYQKPF